MSEPKKLYHYTNMKGLTGILESSRLWLSDIEFLNDHKEYSYFTDMVFDILENDTHGLESDEYEWVKNVLENSKDYSELVRIFVGSFTTEADLLPQWRGYSDGTGFNLLFQFKDLYSLCQKQRCSLVEVNYEETEARKYAAEVVGLLRDAYALDDEDDRGAAEGIVITHMHVNAATFKHPSFSGEREWRILYPLLVGLRGRGTNTVKLRSGNSLLIPYTSIDLMDHSQDCDKENCECNSIINTITIGPGQDKLSQKRALSIYLSSDPRHQCWINGSDIPFRGV